MTSTSKCYIFTTQEEIKIEELKEELKDLRKEFREFKLEFREMIHGLISHNDQRINRRVDQVHGQIVEEAERLNQVHGQLVEEVERLDEIIPLDLGRRLERVEQDVAQRQ